MNTLERLFVGAFGILLLGTGAYLLIRGTVAAMWRFPGGIVLCALGGNAIHGALVGKRPWISRIGPLP